ncbi:unnamed protein product [Tilletia laevis]|nr:unnamed protein product [Tilletia laevis]
MAHQRIFVVGGSGFLGSAIVKQAVARGWEVVSIRHAQAFYPSRHADNSIHITYRKALSVARAFIESRTGICPLTSTPTSTPAPFVYISAEDIFRPIVSERYIKTKREAEYELSRLALDSLNASFSSSSISLSSLATAAAKEPVIRPFFVRPGLMYHPQTRPLSTFPAALLDLSASIHARLEPASSTSVPGNDDPLSSQRQSSSASRLPFGLRIPTPASLIRSLGPEGVQPLADLLTLPPLHIDTVAKAVCAAIAGEAQEKRIGLSVTAQVEAREAPISVGEVLATSDIRRLAGWKS